MYLSAVPRTRVTGRDPDEHTSSSGRALVGKILGLVRLKKLEQLHQLGDQHRHVLPLQLGVRKQLLRRGFAVGAGVGGRAW